MRNLLTRWQPLGLRLLLSLASLLAYAPLLTLQVLYVTDDIFTSDIASGELPGRMLVGAALRDGFLPTWTPRLCSGFPLEVLAGEPLSSSLFALFSPVVALDLWVLTLILIAAHGAFSLARRLGASSAGALLAGVAFAQSGYFATQLKHLSIIATLCWLPWGFCAIWSLFSGLRREAGVGGGGRSELLTALGPLSGFAAVIGMQLLAGFPQSAYISALAYLAFAAYCVGPWLLGRGGRPGAGLARLGLSGVAALLGLGMGAATWLPLYELGKLSDRGAEQTYEWATMLPYSLGDLWNLLVPYPNGDVGQGTYLFGSHSLFWEGYGYVGLATALLALVALVLGYRRGLTAFIVLLTGVSLLLVLGRNTPVFRWAWAFVPGMKLFRFPTRFLIVVELGLCLLGALGLTWFQQALPRRPSWRRVKMLLPWGLALLTAAELGYHHQRQNPFVWARDWFAPPATVQAIRQRVPVGAPRIYTPEHKRLHTEAFMRASGWKDLRPYFSQREFIEPNTGVYYGLSAPNGYVGIAPRWHVDVWGDHNRAGVADQGLLADASDRMLPTPGLLRLLSAHSVRFLLSSHDFELPGLAKLPRSGAVQVYENLRALPRFRLVSDYEVTESTASAVLTPGFEPAVTVALSSQPHWPSSLPQPASVNEDGVSLKYEQPDQLRLEVRSTGERLLVVSDTDFPGWEAQLDGVRVPILRAYGDVRALAIPAGVHEVRFAYVASAFRRGALLSLCCALGILAAALLAWRGRRLRPNAA